MTDKESSKIPNPNFPMPSACEPNIPLNLKTLGEHNQQVFDTYKCEKSGVKCPKCDGELVYTEDMTLYMSFPPQRESICSRCLHREKLAQ